MSRPAAACECSTGVLRGVLFPWNSDKGVAGVERCDLCQLYESDDAAAGALGAYLAGPEFRGEFRSVDVNDGDNPPDQRLVLHANGRPMSFEDGVRLVGKISVPAKV